MFAEINKAGYELKNYLEDKASIAQLELCDADNLNDFSLLRYLQGHFAEAPTSLGTRTGDKTTLAIPTTSYYCK